MIKKVHKTLVQSFSGGIDSFTTIYKGIIDDGMDTVIPINFTYGQKNEIETLIQKELIIDLKSIFGDKIKDVVEINIENMFPNQSNDLYKKLRDNETIKNKTKTEYYTPMRNMLFSTICAMIGELFSLSDDNEDVINEVYIGMGLHKHSNIYEKDYWDITPEFVKRIESVFELNDSITLKVYSPFKDKFKWELVKFALDNKVNYKKTWTCYNPKIITRNDYILYKPCLKCEACRERELAFKKNNIDDGNTYKYIKVI